MVNLIIAIFLTTLIIIGGIYVIVCEYYPLWERIHITGVMFGTSLGVAILLIS